MNRTGIEWTELTWNPLRGCSRVSRGCGHCYAERMAARFCGETPDQRRSEFHKHGEDRARKINAPFSGIAHWTTLGPRWTGRVELIEAKLSEPMRQRKPATIFVNSMSDTFHELLPDEWVDRMFAVMALCPQHRFIVLTKRSRSMREYAKGMSGAEPWSDRVMAIREATGEYQAFVGYPKDAIIFPLPNVIVGVSAEDQNTADERIPDLLTTPAVCRMASLEPLLGAVDVRPYMAGCCACHLHWVIVGAESGPGARNKDGFMDQARSLKDQCVAAGTPFFLKQAWIDGKLIKMPVLDGKLWDQRPEGWG